MREKLIPLGLLIPAGPGIQEWQREYRDLVFAMVEFAKGREGDEQEHAADFILARRHSGLLKLFTFEEICILLRKATSYQLDQPRLLRDVRQPALSRAGSRQ